jgi:hypothetical protein
MTAPTTIVMWNLGTTSHHVWRIVKSNGLASKLELLRIRCEMANLIIMIDHRLSVMIDVHIMTLVTETRWLAMTASELASGGTSKYVILKKRFDEPVQTVLLEPTMKTWAAVKTSGRS